MKSVMKPEDLQMTISPIIGHVILIEESGKSVVAKVPGRDNVRLSRGQSLVPSLTVWTDNMASILASVRPCDRHMWTKEQLALYSETPTCKKLCERCTELFVPFKLHHTKCHDCAKAMSAGAA